MQLTYTIDQCIALKLGAGYFDLHSDYVLVSALREGPWAYLHFVKRTDEWVNAPNPCQVVVVFEQVSFFQVGEGTQLPNSIEEIGFKEPEDQDPDSFMEQPEDESSHIIFRLENDQFIRIGAQNSFLLTSFLN
ncbi:hypothetical protein GCM10011495_39540 [Hymenobacter frigidus]|uniref:Uncharacterized protein n=1 Tax=Hymenobacter frigidus TaxID=1524095 RepID=A0ABQ2AL40_9BACT|nr:hypothetical protein [Hymenobacter frigidus]GGH91436.1 hypothetical protein GCM10011495_39540 [Hymenobacter frigidus]